jgi:hypothetical protein
MVLNWCILFHMSSHDIAHIHVDHSYIWTTPLPPSLLSLPTTIQPNLCAFHLILIHSKASFVKKTIVMLRIKTPFFHNIMDTPWNPSFFSIETLNKCHITINSLQQKRGNRNIPVAPSQETNYRPKMVPVKMHQRGREKNQKLQYLKYKRHEEPKQRRIYKTRSNVWENHQNHYR